MSDPTAPSPLHRQFPEELIVYNILQDGTIKPAPLLRDTSEVDSIDSSRTRHLRSDISSRTNQLQRYLIHSVLQNDALTETLMQKIRLAVQFFTVNIEGEIRSENADGRIKVLLHNAEMSKVTKPLLCKYYRPISIFRHVMSHGNVSLSSLAQDTKMRPLRSTGKSQSFLAFSTDKKFVLKSLTRSEAKTLRGTLDDYVAHLDQHPNTLLPRFYSLFSITLHRHYQLYMCVMNNVFEHVDPMRSLQDVYDLKGSVHNRTSNKQESQKRQWKDNDLRMHNDQKGTKRLIHPLDTSVRADLLSQLESDVAWLQRFSLMDYSLLVGRVDQTTSPHSSNSKQDRGTLCCIVPAAASEFHLGIIDVLQVWNAKKRAAMLAKSIAYRRTELSTVPPDKYATRFMHFISNYVI